MSTEPTLAEFLLARIVEDEVDANGSHTLGCHCTDTCYAPTWGAPDFSRCTCRVRPALAECEAKRQIVAEVQTWRHLVVEDCWYTCPAATEEREGEECCDDLRRGGGCDCGLDYRVEKILRPLALPYANHRDYRPEWSA